MMNPEVFTREIERIRATNDGIEREILEELAKGILATFATSIAGSHRFDTHFNRACEVLGWSYEDAWEWMYGPGHQEWRATYPIELKRREGGDKIDS